MRQLPKVGFYLAALIMLASCTENNSANFIMEKPQSVAVQDSVDSNYSPLKTYVDTLNSNFKLGAGVSVSAYAEQGTMFGLVNSNFQEVAVGGNMSHGAIVQADGSINMESVTDFLNVAQESGISVYGQTLVGHTNQNSSYLNSLIGPLTVETPPYPNSIDLSGLKDGTMNSWTANPSGNVSIEAGEGLTSNSNGVILMAGTNVSEPADLQFTTPDIPVNSGSEYHVEFFIKSDSYGEGRISFEGLENNTPEKDWTGSGEASATFETGIGWKKISFNISGFTEESIKINLDLGYESDVTYYVDVNNFYVFDTNAEPVTSNLVTNGDFESGGAFGGWGMDDSGVTEDGMGVNSAGNSEGHAMFVTNNEADANFWGVQTSYPFPSADDIENGTTYNLEFWVKGTAEGTIQPEIQNPTNYSADGFGDVNVTTEWQKVELSTTASVAAAEAHERLIISYGYFEGTVYIDKVKFYDAAGATTETLIVEKTAQEKELITETALQDWISGILSGASSVDAWNVVNEPIADTGPMVGQDGFQLKTGGTAAASGEFYWQDYIGPDYGVQAFTSAREHGDDNDLLFINDYGLESNLDKCRALINYVEYIENNGATVDGIGTQMNISINTSEQNITQMLELLAATGKMVKISGLNVGLGGISAEAATPELFEAQSEMYQYVVDQYFSIVPEEQRYGITVMNPVDSGAGLWTSDYDRKRAYAGFAVGIMSGFNSEN